MTNLNKRFDERRRHVPCDNPHEDRSRAGQDPRGRVLEAPAKTPDHALYGERRQNKRKQGAMPTNYLTADELAELIGCAATSFACMRRYLERHSWPFEPNLRGFPRVSRVYHDARMSGAAAPGPAADAGAEPDFSMFSQ